MGEPEQKGNAYWVEARQLLRAPDTARAPERVPWPFGSRLAIEILVALLVLAILASWGAWQIARRAWSDSRPPVLAAEMTPLAWRDPDPPGGERYVTLLEGTVGPSLFRSMLYRGGSPRLARELAEIFAWDIDFATQSRPGDAFTVVYERLYDADGSERTGRILAARYRSAERELVAIWFEDGSAPGDYYTPAGNSVRRPFLRAPLPYTEISSRYSHARLHPTLQVWRPHRGTDYAAAEGTPIWAVANGEVIYRGWDGPNGRIVKLRHADGYVSYYSHLSRFARGVRIGTRVQQKGVLGFVGSSGVSTGPHLDYRLARNGRFLDPLRMPYPLGPTIQGAALARFRDRAARSLAVLEGASPPDILTGEEAG